MNDTPTPETDTSQHEGLLRGNPMPTQVVHVNFARKLERERDGAREALAAEIKHHTETTAKWNGHHMDLTISQCDLNKAIRERDEAREQIEVCRGIIERTVIARNSALSELTDLERERDEAREAWYEMQSSFERSRDEVEKLIRERDEAREALMRIEEVFIDSDDTYEDLIKIGNIARAALGSKNYDPVA